MHFKQIVHCTVEYPLNVNFPFPSKGKSVQPYCGTNIAKYRLCRPKPPVVDKSTFYRIYFALHLLGEGLWLLLQSPLKEVNLSRFSMLWMPQASLP